MIPGLRWQLEWDEEVEPDEDFFDEKDPEKPLQGFAYLVMGNQQAEVQLQQLWRLWVAGHPLPHGCAPWKDAFKLLRAIRPWSDEDRIRGTGMAEYAHEEIGLGRDLVPCEAELCFRESPNERLAAEQRVRRHVENAGGQVISQFAHDGIRYHGVLFKLPPTAIQALADLNADIALLRADDVFLIRPAGQSLSRLPSPPLEAPASVAPTRSTARPSKEAVAALLDGLPLQNHVLLRDRLVIVNPEAEYLGNLREHGTQMASAIIHGDLSANEPALDRPLVVRPIMVAAAPPLGVECLPEDRLVTDLVHQAVRDLIAGDTPAAPGVRIINLSIADRFAQFDRTVSSWAKMLDWLAYEHNLLFVVSAGNHDHSRDGALETDIARVDWPTLTVEQKQDAILRAIYADLRNRRLRPPSEAVNVLTVGSVARDG